MRSDACSSPDYSTYCAPQAVAAVTDLTPREAAVVIQATAAAFGMERPTAETAHVAMIRALMALDVEVQAWAGWGELLTRQDKYRAQLMAAPTPALDLDTAPEAVRTAVLAERRQLATRSTPPTPPRLTVDEWLSRYPHATWLLTLDTHVLAARDGGIIAGGDTYGDHAIRAANRILTRGS